MKEGGLVVSMAIKLFAYAKVVMTSSPKIDIYLRDFKKRATFNLGESLPYDGGVFDHFRAVLNRIDLNQGVDIKVWGDFPPGSGLGSSSSIAVALLGALFKLEGRRLSRNKIAKLAIEVEREMLKIPGGWQDQYAAAFGGFNKIIFQTDGKISLKPLKIPKRVLNKLEKRLMLFYMGQKRSERTQQTELEMQIRKRGEGKKAMKSLKRFADEASYTLENGELDKFAKILHQAWLAKKRTNPKVTTERVDKLYKLALKNGAQGGKLLGSGGGGTLLIYAKPEFQEKTIKDFKKEGARYIPVEISKDGLQVTKNEG